MKAILIVIALTVTSKPPQAPAIPQGWNDSHSRKIHKGHAVKATPRNVVPPLPVIDVTPLPVGKTCECSGLCSCGCNDGKPCTCPHAVYGAPTRKYFAYGYYKWDAATETSTVLWGVSNRSYPVASDSAVYATREEAQAEADRLNGVPVIRQTYPTYTVPHTSYILPQQSFRSIRGGSSGGC